MTRRETLLALAERVEQSTGDKKPSVPVGPFDKNGRAIEVGDILKVFHFVHYLRRRHCFMYKQVLGTREWPSGSQAFRIGHLDMTDADYYEMRDGRTLHHCEIVQGIHDDPYERARQDPT